MKLRRRELARKQFSDARALRHVFLDGEVVGVMATAVQSVLETPPHLRTDHDLRNLDSALHIVRYQVELVRQFFFFWSLCRC